MATMSEAILLRGEDASLTPSVGLRAGPLDMVFEPDTAFLRYVCAGDEEVVRGVYVAVRDHDWGTVEPSLSGLEIDAREDAFDVRFVADCRQDHIHFVWRGAITGSPDGVVRFSMDGEARGRFRRNRIGFCVLHSMAVAGRKCRVEGVDGSRADGEFPLRISAHQPFMDIRAISHDLHAGGVAEVRMEGDAFEMEDQRNWTDASYKTYCTPLALPFPVTVEPGEAVRQSVTIAAPGASAAPRSTRGSTYATPTVRLGRDIVGSIPTIGLGSPSHDASPTEVEVARLRDLRAGHLRVDIRAGDPAWRKAAARAARLAEDIDTPLEVAILLPPASADEAVADVFDWAHDRRPRVARWIVLHDDMTTTSKQTFTATRDVLSSYDEDAPFGVGTDCYFTELNRDRPEVGDADFVSYSMNPQVHAFDDASLMETLEAQSVTVDSARAFSGGAPVVVSPVTLRPRFNPNATGEASEAKPDELPFEVDPRQMSLFAAAWTLGSVAGLASAGAASVTYYEPTGLRGVMDASAARETPDGFARAEGAVYPLYHVLRDVLGVAGGQVLRAEASDPRAVAALSVETESRRAVWVANLGPSAREVRIEGLPPGRYALRTLDITNAERAMWEPGEYREDITHMNADGRSTTVTLGGYAVAWLVTDPAR